MFLSETIDIFYLLNVSDFRFFLSSFYDKIAENASKIYLLCDVSKQRQKEEKQWFLHAKYDRFVENLVKI